MHFSIDYVSSQFLLFIFYFFLLGVLTNALNTSLIFNFPVSAFREKVVRTSETGMILLHRIKVTGKFTYLGEDIHRSKMSQGSDSSISAPLTLKQPSPHTESQGVLARLTVDGESPEAGPVLIFLPFPSSLQTVRS